MVGKLDIGRGDDSGFYPRLAKAKAEGANVNPFPPEVDPADERDFTDGSFSTKNGIIYWLQRESGAWFAWLNTDEDETTADERFPLKQLLDDNPGPDADEARAKAIELGWDEVSFAEARAKAESLGWDGIS